MGGDRRLSGCKDSGHGRDRLFFSAIHGVRIYQGRQVSGCERERDEISAGFRYQKFGRIIEGLMSASIRAVYRFRFRLGKPKTRFRFLGIPMQDVSVSMLSVM